MRKYFDAEGKPTTADKAVSSKGLQGGCATFFVIVFALFLLVIVIILIVHH